MLKVHLIFDIANQQTEHVLKIDENKWFLADQREPRKMSMADDKDLSKKEARVAKHKIRLEPRQKHEMLRKSAEGSSSSNRATTIARACSNVNDDEDDNDDDDDDGNLNLADDDDDGNMNLAMKSRSHCTTKNSRIPHYLSKLLICG